MIKRTLVTIYYVVSKLTKGLHECLGARPSAAESTYSLRDVAGCALFLPIGSHVRSELSK